MSSPRARRARGVAALVLLLSQVAACAGTTGHLAAASNRDINIAQVNFAAPGRHIVGRNCIDLIVVFPTSMPNFGQAIADALHATGGTVLTNVRIGYEIVYFPFVFGVACYVVEGDAL